MNNWQKIKLGDLGRVVTGKTPSTKILENFGGPYPFITIPDLKNKKYIISSERTLSERGAKSMLSLKLPPKTVMLSCLATVGEVGIAIKESFTNQQINSLICDKEKANPEFIYYALIYIKPTLEGIGGGGSVYTNISKTKFFEIEVKIPIDVSEQQKVSRVLGALDDKIELNNKINQTLEQMAQAIFKEWFVDFRFPGYEQAEFVDSELGRIPKEWRVGELKDIADLIMGLSPKSKYYNTNRVGLPLLNGAADYDGLILNPDKYTSQLTRVAPKKDIIFCIRATIGNVVIADKDYCIGRGVASLRPKEETYYYFTFITLNKLIKEFKQISAGSVIAGLTKDDIAKNKVIIPDNKLLTRFQTIVEPMYKEIEKNILENKNLSSLRDLLLPKLMSGEIEL